MWLVVKTLIQEELRRIGRRLLRRPEPPSPYAHYRNQRRSHPAEAEPTPIEPAPVERDVASR